MTYTRTKSQRVRITGKKNFPYGASARKRAVKRGTIFKVAGIPANRIAGLQTAALLSGTDDRAPDVAKHPLVLQARERLKGFEPFLPDALRGFDGPEVIGRPTVRRSRQE